LYAAPGEECTACGVGCGGGGPGSGAMSYVGTGQGEYIQACMVEEQVDSEQVELEQVACMVAQLVVGAMAPAAVAVLAHVESPQGRSAQLAESAVVVEDPVQVLCHTWELVRESTYKKPPTSMLDVEVTSTLFDQREISPASSQVAVC